MDDLPLGQEERVVWSGRPAPWRYAMESLPRIKLGCLFFCGGIIFSVAFWGVESARNALWPCLLPLLASAGGIAMMSVFPLRYRHAGQLVYVITNLRALIYDESAESTLRSFSLGEFAAPGLVKHSGGSCDLVFHVDVPPRLDETELEHTAQIVRHGLIAIQDNTGLSEWLEDHLAARRTAANAEAEVARDSDGPSTLSSS